MKLYETHLRIEAGKEIHAIDVTHDGGQTWENFVSIDAGNDPGMVKFNNAVAFLEDVCGCVEYIPEVA